MLGAVLEIDLRPGLPESAASPARSSADFGDEPGPKRPAGGAPRLGGRARVLQAPAAAVYR